MKTNKMKIKNKSSRFLFLDIAILASRPTLLSPLQVTSVNPLRNSSCSAFPKGATDITQLDIAVPARGNFSLNLKILEKIINFRVIIEIQRMVWVKNFFGAFKMNINCRKKFTNSAEDFFLAITMF